MDPALIGDALERAIVAAETLGLETAEARAVTRTIEERRGYPGELYVLGLAGGTGVGKSSLLNAIAGADVSPAGARRPTTTSPVALLPAGHETEAAPLIEWLGGAEVQTWAGDGSAVAIVDLPDLDSIEPAHAARVDAVLPKIDDVEIEINPADLETDVYTSSGPGGQHMQKNSTAVRITHKPSGMVVSCESERSQTQNRERAMAVLRARLYEAEQQRQVEERGEERRLQVGSGGRSEKIRTYNYPQNRVTDHRIGLTLYRLETIVDGDLDEFIDELATTEQAERLQAIGA